MKFGLVSCIFPPVGAGPIEETNGWLISSRFTNFRKRIVPLEVRTDSAILAFHGSFLEEVCRQYATKVF